MNWASIFDSIANIPMRYGYYYNDKGLDRPMQYYCISGKIGAFPQYDNRYGVLIAETDDILHGYLKRDLDKIVKERGL